MAEIRIERIESDKKRFLPLLLLGDEQESMIDRYLERGELYVLFEEEPRALCVLTREPEGVFELKNLAVEPAFQRRGYARRLLEFVFARCGESPLILGTGEVPEILDFYARFGFRYSRRVKGFFTENYDHPMFEGGRQLVDMIYLRREPPTTR